MDIKSQLKSWNKKTISKSELGTLLHADSDAKLYPLVAYAVDNHLLSPIQSSQTNGNRTYPLYQKYRITMVETSADVLADIQLLHPAMLKTGYLSSNPELFLKYKDALLKLNTYLFRRNAEVAVSKKERSFDIFDEEKQLDDASFRRLLDNIGLTSAELRYYETPAYCFHDFIPERKPQMTLLICENKDIWFNIRRRMYEDHAQEIFGTPIDGTVYGSGNEVSEAGALSAYTRFMGTDDVDYLYWGDIDRAGLNIFLSLIKNNPDTHIRIFTEAYMEMVTLSEGRALPDSADHRERMGEYEAIYRLFPAPVRAKLVQCIQDNKRIPQEIVSYASLLTYMR